MLHGFYHEHYIQQHRWELEREAEQMRLAASARPQGKVTHRLMNQLGELLIGLNLQGMLKLKKQPQSQPKAITGIL